jgi:hypothetical protein
MEDKGIYRLKFDYVIEHSGFVSDGKKKCWCLATTKTPAIGSTLTHLFNKLKQIDYLEKTTIEDNKWIIPHINKEVIVILNNLT